MRFPKTLLSAGVAGVMLGAFALNAMTAEAAVTPAAVVTALPAAKSGKAAPGGGSAKTLVLYDTTGDYGWMGEVYATQTANLSSHFGSWTAAPVGSYKAGDLNAYTAVVYVGSTYDEPVPDAFLADVAATTKPVTWLYDNIWQLTANPAFAAGHGFTSGGFDYADVAEVTYKSQKLTRDTRNKSGIMNLSITDATKVKTLASAVRPDGSTFPWAITSGNFTYVAEIPFAYVTHDDRYLAFADLLFDSLGADVKEQHRGLVRIEDVGPDSDPDELRAVADYLSAEKVPFTVAVYTRYRDPKGVNNGGKAQDYTLLSKPKVVSALKYMQSKGGTLLMHGYTHQYGNLANPYDGVSANDFEFYAAHVDENDSVIYDGPVPGDSAAWATSRMVAAGLIFTAAGLGTPSIFELPHYAGSAVDYQAVNTLFGKRYDRGLYFPGVLTGAKPDYKRQFGQFFPYAVRDVYGSVVVPENIGNIEPDSFNNHPARLPSDLIASARRNLVVRDGVASFFYHPYLGTDYLKQVVTGVKAQGYTFVTATSMIAGK
ncbi:hypothetical protein Aab01nite_65410 [Paractinoplanes abujensis]|uniref:Uncharacterized protein YdaL n=1 Tax=Paractinoplanes abujensis TaxID=882441 RepID=A0A7W7CPV7_9ACTN|nr:polysaccharide deacetylase family protein [Actinoplanes abujensis]MBB4692550.1 uncharacterized protein YdaL [Actinoplanes abujensis]GID22951.1 hypothetical protein Aab01nite_65410 [Actinoplanes abujensis]